jgi:hypothetical protein
MGVVLSANKFSCKEETAKTVHAFTSLQIEKVRDLVLVFVEHSVGPLLGRQDLSFMVRNAIDIPVDDEMLIDSLWDTFRNGEVVHTYELLATVILTSDCPWENRLKFLFLIFKCTGTEEIMFADICTAVKSIVVGLTRFWDQLKFVDTMKLSQVAEGIANNAFMKLEKELDDSINQSSFLIWASERFDSSRSVEDYASLISLLHSPFQQQIDTTPAELSYEFEVSEMKS